MGPSNLKCFYYLILGGQLFISFYAQSLICPLKELININQIIEASKKGEINSPKELLNCLPEIYRHNYTLVYDSLAPERDEVNYLYPRVISFGLDAKFVFAFVGNPEGASRNKVQIFDQSHYPPDHYEFDYSKLELKEHTDKETNPENPQNHSSFVSKNPKSCLSCHKGPMVNDGSTTRNFFKPRWDDYPIWKGAYGSLNDVFEYQNHEDSHSSSSAQAPAALAGANQERRFQEGDSTRNLRNDVLDKFDARFKFYEENGAKKFKYKLAETSSDSESSPSQKPKGQLTSIDDFFRQFHRSSSEKRNEVIEFIQFETEQYKKFLNSIQTQGSKSFYSGLRNPLPAFSSDWKFDHPKNSEAPPPQSSNLLLSFTLAMTTARNFFNHFKDKPEFKNKLKNVRLMCEEFLKAPKENQVTLKENLKRNLDNEIYKIKTEMTLEQNFNEYQKIINQLFADKTRFSSNNAYYEVPLNEISMFDPSIKSYFTFELHKFISDLSRINVQTENQNTQSIPGAPLGNKTSPQSLKTLQDLALNIQSKFVEQQPLKEKETHGKTPLDYGQLTYDFYEKEMPKFQFIFNAENFCNNLINFIDGGELLPPPQDCN
jgi:hypothetical protein